MKRIFLTSFLIFSFVLVTTVYANDAYAKSDYTKPVITTQGNIYEVSKTPTTVSLFVSAYDDVDGKVRVDCDKSEKTVFKVGETTVRCYSVDSSGNMAKASFVVKVGYNFVKIPDWFKQTTQFWVNNNISDREYADTIQFLMEEKIFHVPFVSNLIDTTDTDIPIWIKTNSQNWIDGNASTDEFSIGIQWMIERGLVFV
jgi:hypothetical protein